MFYVYILLSGKDNKFYTGSTSNLVERFKKHVDGKVTSTKHRRPLTLIYYEACKNRRDAMRREIYLKTSWGKRYIKGRLKYYLEAI